MDSQSMHFDWNFLDKSGRMALPAGRIEAEDVVTMRAGGKQSIPAFRLYGESADITVPSFVHAEGIRSSASLHNWEIGVHRHAHLTQAIIVTEGGGTFRIDTWQGEIVVPWLLWIPAGVVHTFSFQPGSDGVVASLADDFLASVIAHDHEADRLHEVAGAAFSGRPAPPDEIEMDLEMVFENLMREVVVPLPGSVSAVAALVKLLLVGLLRTRAVRSVTEPSAMARADLHRRFRRLIERHLRENWPVSRFAAELGVTADRLHAACTETIGKAPQVILHDRVMLEAKRGLIYTILPISKIAFDLGFNDPAYFSRFFTSRAGMSPAAYRKMGGVQVQAPRAAD